MMKVLKLIARIFLYVVGSMVLLYVTFYLLAWGDYHVAPTVEHDANIPHLTLDGVTMHVETFGSDTNEVVIVLHGGPGNDYRYLLDLKALSDQYFVVFYDQRGTGLSPRVPAEELTVESLIKDLNNIADHFGKGRKVNIIGHSWGGMLATAFIARHPEVVDKLVLAEPGPLTQEMANNYNAEMQLSLSFELLVHLGKCYFKSLHVEEIDDQARGDYFFQTFAMDTTVSDHPLAGYFCNKDINKLNLDFWRHSGTSSYQIMFKSMQDAEEKMNLAVGAEAFQNKILMIAGECNELVGPEFQEKQMSLFHDIEMKIIQNTGHFMFGEQPEQSMMFIREYFSE